MLALTEAVSGLRARVPGWQRELGVPGAGVALVRGGELAWAGGFGVVDADRGGRVGEGTVFPVASLAKPVVAWLTVELAAQGRLDLDRSLAAYLPAPWEGGESGLEAITARQVLTHSSGLPNWRPYGRPLLPEAAPGERFSYSGEAFTYLQRILEELDGEPLAALARRRLFAPLGLERTGFALDPDWGDDVARPHGRRGRPYGGDLAPFPPPAEPQRAADGSRAAAGGLWSTAGEYARFVALAIGGRGGTGGPVLSEPWLGQMHRLHFAVAPGAGWGLGWALRQRFGRTFSTHSGHNRGCASAVLADRGRGSALVVLTNGDRGGELYARIATLG